MKRDSAWPEILRDSIVIAIVIGVAASVYANRLSDALRGSKPDWYYVIVAVSVIVVLACVRAVWILAAKAKNEPVPPSTTVPPSASGPISLGAAARLADRSVGFLGVTAKRSILDDEFKMALQQHAGSKFQVRLILLDPSSDAFTTRADEEQESAVAWRGELESTIERLSSYRSRFGIDIRLRLTRLYPVWRLIVVDQDTAYVNVFLPGRRGTESTQREVGPAESELAFGFVRSFDALWDSCDLEVEL